MHLRELWQITIIKNLSPKILWCFPYNTPTPAYPPYPGFEVLEKWLDDNFTCSYERLYNNGRPVLEVIFSSQEDLFLFLLKKT